MTIFVSLFLLFCIQTSQAATTCNAGSYFNQDRQTCEYCPTGTYSNTTGTIGACNICPIGYRLKYPSYTGNTQCIICDPGTYEVNRTDCYYCPRGTSTNISGTSENCTACPAGSYTYYNGRTQCSVCPAGTYELGRSDCYNCPRGTYSNAGSTGACTTCPAGYYAYSTGRSVCTICPAGTYEVNRTDCFSCPKGTYSPFPGASGPESCIPCPAGSKATNTGSTQCTICGPGEYEVNRTSCYYCPVGTYSSESGSVACTPCPPGSKTTYDNYRGYLGNTQCKKCLPGEYELNRVSCPDCPAGTFSSSEGSASCTPCPPGWKTPKDYANTKCVQCLAGEYELNNVRCPDCPAGTYSDPGSSGISSCRSCPPGSIVNSNKTGCVTCPAGTYESGGDKCSYCPEGTYSNTMGVSGYESCKKCPEGTRTRPGYIGNTECFKCEPGTYEVDRRSCYYCLPGTYSPGGISGGCLACTPGNVAPSSSSTQCFPCPAGTYEDERRSCYYCPAKTHSLPGAVRCVSNFIPDAIQGPINLDLIEVTLKNTADFLESAVNGLCLDDIREKVERLENVPNVFENTWKSWHNVSWANMSSVKSAIISTSNATVDLLDVVEDWTPLNSKRLLQSFIVFVAPPAAPIVLAYEAGMFAYRLGGQVRDVTEEIKQIHEGVKNNNYTQAGYGFGSLVKTALELKESGTKLGE